MDRAASVSERDRCPGTKRGFSRASSMVSATVRPRWLRLRSASGGFRCRFLSEAEGERSRRQRLLAETMDDPRDAQRGWDPRWSFAPSSAPAGNSHPHPTPLPPAGEGRLAVGRLSWPEGSSPKSQALEHNSRPIPGWAESRGAAAAAHCRPLGCLWRLSFPLPLAGEGQGEGGIWRQINSLQPATKPRCASRGDEALFKSAGPALAHARGSIGPFRCEPVPSWSRNPMNPQRQSTAEKEPHPDDIGSRR